MQSEVSFFEFGKTYFFKILCSRCGAYIGEGRAEKVNKYSIDICRKCAVDMYENELKEGK